MEQITLLDSADATANHTTAQHNITHNNQFSLQCIPSSLDADYLITLQVSNDGTNWSTYKLNAEVIDRTINEFIFDEILPAPFFRVVYGANSNSTGTITIILNLLRTNQR